MAGYSGTPLVKKLGIKEGYVVHTVGAPTEYRDLLKGLPAGVRFEAAATTLTNMVHVFETQRSGLNAGLATLRKTLAPHAIVWVSWPKKSSNVATTITDDVIRELALPLGFVDVKVCTVTDVWSGLKLVVRRELR
jgi:hypothetical protein